MTQISVIGSGAWGTAIALSLAQRGGHAVTLWSHDPRVTDTIQRTGENQAFLPGFQLPHTIMTTADLRAALAGAGIVVSVMPSQHVRRMYTEMAPYLGEEQILVSATKGVEHGTHLRMSEVIADVLGNGARIGVLSGPSFAQEVAAGVPTALTIASTDAALAAHVQREFASLSLRLYTNDDVIGVELGGALKNVIAIATGVVAGLELGYNPAAALITRGIAEVTRLAVACGGRSETLAGLAGIGDLVLTCTGALSRNRRVGIELGKGRALADVLTGLGGKVAEGVGTTEAALQLARAHSVEMPITEQMWAVLNDGKPPLEAMRELMSRPGRDEF